MLTVDTILAHGTVLTMDEAHTLLEDGAVAIQGASIAAVGPTAQVLSAYQAGEVVDCSDCAVLPGLVNDHTHVSMTLVRFLAVDLRFEV